MKRLTYDFEIGGNHCWQVRGADNLECREVCERQGDNGCKTCPISKAFDRLAAIEDILCDDTDEYDLDRLAVMCNQRMTMREEVSQRFSLTAKIPLDRLREMAEAERDGRCVVLPCKLGDTVYFITGTYNSLVKPAKVEEIYIGDGSIALGVSTDFTTFTLQESEWHLTRAEAEAALKAREQND